MGVRKLFETTYVRMIVGGLVMFCGVMGGIWVAYAVIAEPEPPQPKFYKGDEELKQGWIDRGLQPYIKEGDLFPQVEYQYEDSSIGSFEELLSGQMTALLFVHFECGACLDLLTDWERTVRPNLKPGIKTVVCAGQEPFHLPKQLKQELSNFDLVFIDREYFQETHNIKVWPSLMVTDKYGLITDVQVGYPAKFKMNMTNRLTVQR